ncbi:MAG: hypothetical protein AAF732_14945 [Pseudomonadota bacterium]
MSRDTIYRHYGLIRWRVILTGYYANGAYAKDEAGLSDVLQREIRLRRGIPQDHIYPHAAELIAWAQEWSPRLTLKHIKKIVSLTGPLDKPPALTDCEGQRLVAYINMAHIELLIDELLAGPVQDEAQRSLTARARERLEDYRRNYRAACKRIEQSPERPVIPMRHKKRVLQP